MNPDIKTVREASRYKRLPPWERTFLQIRRRTSYKTFHGYKNYGGRGIKNLITKDELKSLWFRDEGYKLHRPSIDRIDVNGHYTYKNCRYIEVSENCLGFRRKPKCGYGHKFGKDNTIIKNKFDKRYGKSFNVRSCRKCQKRINSAWCKKFRNKGVVKK